MVGALIVFGFSAAMLVFVVLVATSKDKPEKYDWMLNEEVDEDG